MNKAMAGCSFRGAMHASRVEAADMKLGLEATMRAACSPTGGRVSGEEIINSVD
jgi:hypothetical protein